MTGVVWFDRNRNGSYDAGEWPIPNALVRLTGVGANSRTETLRTDGVPYWGIESAEVPTVRSAADGRYVFTSVVPGAYQVRADVRMKGFDYTSDTDGSADWVVGVSVPANTVAVADFAGVGRGEVAGKVFERTTAVGLAGATVLCTWAGFDDIPGTADDAVFQVTGRADGTFDLVGVPYGNYSCKGRDVTSGRESASAAAVVDSPNRVEAPLPLSGAAVPSGVLPATGSDPAGSVVPALLSVLLGALALVLARTRRSTATG